MSSSGEERRRRPRPRFERHASRVVFDPSSSSFVVTWSKCGIPDGERLTSRRCPGNWIPSISAVASLYDRGRIPQGQVVFAARAIGRAWAEGDREFLDTDGAKRAAELVHDLSSMCVDPGSPAVARDMGEAMRSLLDEMARVRFGDVPESDLEEGAVMPSVGKALSECLGIDGFTSWPRESMRRRFLYCLGRKERTDVAYTLAALMFDCGSCPLLSLSDRRILKVRSMEAMWAESAASTGNATLGGLLAFARYALSRMREMKSSGRTSLGERITQQQLADIISVGSPLPSEPSRKQGDGTTYTQEKERNRQ